MMHIFRTIVEEFQILDTSTKQLRKFGFMIGGILLLISVVAVVFFGKTLHVSMPTIGVIFIVLAFLLPQLLLWPYYLWMGIAIVLGSIVSPVFLALLFFGFLTPIGLLKRLFSRSKKSSVNTYWLPHAGSKDPKRMEELF